MGVSRRLRGLSVRVALAVGSLAITLAAMEVAARLVLPRPQVVELEPVAPLEVQPGPVEDREQDQGIDVLLDWSGQHGVRLRPNTRATIHDHLLSHRDVVIETDSLGLRHPELEPKRKGDFRVLVMGDSITFGDYVPFGETYPALLHERLASDGIDHLEVINAGLPGASTADEFHHYLEIRDAVQPDLVLVGMYLNDAQNSNQFYARSLPRPWSSSRFLAWVASRFERLRLKLMEDVVPPELDPDWGERFRAGRDLRSGYMFRDPAAFDFEIYNARNDFGLAWNPQAWRALRPIVRVWSLAAAERGERFTMCLLPVHLQILGTVPDDRPQREFSAMCHDLDLPCLDLRPPLREAWQRDRRTLYYDHCHMTPEGNRVVAGAIADWLRRSGLVPAGGS